MCFIYNIDIYIHNNEKVINHYYFCVKMVKFGQHFTDI